MDAPCSNAAASAACNCAARSASPASCAKIYSLMKHCRAKAQEKASPSCDDGECPAICSRPRRAAVKSASSSRSWLGALDSSSSNRSSEPRAENSPHPRSGPRNTAMAGFCLIKSAQTRARSSGRSQSSLKARSKSGLNPSTWLSISMSFTHCTNMRRVSGPSCAAKARKLEASASR
jgi:hypothetical protein